MNPARHSTPPDADIGCSRYLDVRGQNEMSQTRVKVLQLNTLHWIVRSRSNINNFISANDEGFSILTISTSTPKLFIKFNV